VPYLFLLTDGAVRNERNIVNTVRARLQQMAQEIGIAPRIMTLGIGPYTNSFFLKMLAAYGRGFSELCLDPKDIFDMIHSLVSRSSIPILKNIQLMMDNQAYQNVELYPPEIPDLFVGAPLLISGRYTPGPMGGWPPAMRLQGEWPNGERCEFEVPFRDPQVDNNQGFSSPLPVAKMMIRQRIDLLTADAWLCEEVNPAEFARLKDMIIQESCQHQIVSTYTTMVAVETTPQKYEEANQKNKKSGGVSSGVIVAAAVGGVVILGAGAALLFFGSAGATDAGTAIGEGFAMLGADVLGPAFEFIGEGVVAGGEAVGECCGGLCGLCGDCDCIGDCCGNIGDCCGNIGDCAGDCCGNIGECFGNIPWDGIGDCCGNFCECLGNIAGNLG